MTRKILSIVLPILTMALSTQVLSAQNNQEEEKSPEELAFEEAERLEGLLKLEPHQTFFIDSTLQHDMRALHDEIMNLEMSGTQEQTVYRMVQEKWLEQIENSYRKILSEEQWLIYRKDMGKLTKEELKALKAIEKEQKKARKARD